MTKFLSSPVIVSLIGFIATIVVALLNNRKKDPEYMAIMKGLIENVFSRFHFEVNDVNVDTTKIHEFLEYLDEQKYSGYLIELYALANKVVDASNDVGNEDKKINQILTYKKFAKKYEHSNKKIRRSFGMKAPTTFSIFDSGIASIAFIVTLSYAFISTGGALGETPNLNSISFTDLTSIFWNILIILGFFGLCMTGFLIVKQQAYINKLSKEIKKNQTKKINNIFNIPSKSLFEHLVELN